LSERKGERNEQKTEPQRDNPSGEFANHLFSRQIVTIDQGAKVFDLWRVARRANAIRKQGEITAGGQ
jgi:hypothetical protein